MAGQQTISFDRADVGPGQGSGGGVVTAFVLLWSCDQPGRVGEIALVPGGFPGAEALLGRAGCELDEDVPHVEWARQRPGELRPTGPLATPQLSREQLRLRAGDDGGLLVENIGRNALLVNGARVDRARLSPGDVVEVAAIAVMLCVVRPMSLAGPPYGAAPWPPFRFGAADSFGVVGESPAAWELRARVAFVAPRAAHVLIRGPSGAGKEAVAQATHALSARAKRPMISRNAATIPESLVDAELFGNARNYPNPGMADRPGLVGEADGGSLFLDEFGELPAAVQAHLLRVLDAGEYNRLGEARARRSDLRLIAATNRPDTVFKEDVLARFRVRVDVPGLDGRLEDVPLIARHLLVRICADDPALAARWFPGGDLGAAPRLSPALVTALVRRAYTTNVRELEMLLWRAMADSPGDVLGPWVEGDAPPAAPSLSGDSAPPAAPPGAPPAAGELGPEAIQAALDANNGRIEDTWRALGLSSRHVLARLIKRYGLIIRRGPG